VKLGFWSFAALCVAGATVLYGDTGRFLNPIGEKDLPPFPPGQCDFSLPYLGARALVKGVNPYHNDLPELTSKYFPPVMIDGQQYKQLYPPSQLLLYVPFALWAGEDWQKAGRVWFHVSLLALVGLAVILWLIGRRMLDPELSPVLAVVLAFVLTLNIAVELGLERGQSDNFFALLCWASVLLFVRERYGAATFTAVAAASIKGYPILLAGGLCALALDRRALKASLAGAVGAVLLFVAPVARYLKDGFTGAHHRASMFWDHWYNHGFRNVVASFAPHYGKEGRVVLSVLTLAVTAIAWWNARRAFRARSAQFPLWLVVFATASLAMMVGVSALSVSYDLILVLPGALLLALAQRPIVEQLGWSPRAANALGVGFAAALFLLFKGRLFGVYTGLNLYGLPAAGYGLVALVGLLGAISVRGFLNNRHSAVAPTATSAKPNGITSTV
jgi:hypothetical protein